MKFDARIALSICLLATPAMAGSAKVSYDTCSHEPNNSAQIACLTKQSQALEAQLQGAYEKALTVYMNNAQTLAAFKTAQARWQEFHKANCNVPSADNSRYGQIAANICHVRMQAERINEINYMMKP
jgi:uncharacterized protein YecT (DUF1311 family)